VSDDLNPRSAERLTRAARAAQTLSETLWEALHEELLDRSEIGQRGQRAAELSERLAEIAMAVAALARVDARQPARTDAQQPARPDAPPSPEHDSPRQTPPAVVPQAPSVAVLVDELAPAGEEELLPAPEPPVRERPPEEIEIRDERREESRRERAYGGGVGDGVGSGEEEEGEEEPSAWIASIERRLERYARDRVPFAVLLVELVDVERLRHAELPGEVSRLTGLLETILANELRPADSLTRESPGRYWLLAPETDSPSARALAERLAQTVRLAVTHRGAPLEVAVGIAVCPVDASQAAALAAHADIALYAARASGRPVVEP
jgi:GGDEF domain-containing protein